MKDEIDIDGIAYVPSRSAAKAVGYTQDYVGQLARGGLVDAKKVSGTWYVSLDSIKAHKEKADAYVPTPPHVERQKASQGSEMDTIVAFDGREYISSKRAALLTGYAQDYITQLARTGTVRSKQMGSRWMLDKEHLLAHKKEKDIQLAKVQAASSGFDTSKKTVNKEELVENSLLTYHQEGSPLVPVLKKPEFPTVDEEITVKIPVHKDFGEKDEFTINRSRGLDEKEGYFGEDEEEKQVIKLPSVLVYAVLAILIVGSFSVWTILSPREVVFSRDGVVSQERGSWKDILGMLPDKSNTFSSQHNYKRVRE